MKYETNADVPKPIVDVLPDEALTTWRTTFNDYMDKQDDQKMALATAWTEVRKQGWQKTKDGWQKVDKENGTMAFDDVNVMKENDAEKTFVFKIADMNDEKRIAFGWSVISRDAAGNEVWDLQNDGIDPEDLEMLAYKYVRFYRDSGERHVNSGKAVLIESVVTTIEKQRIWGVPSGVMPIGWWTGFYVLDDAVWEKVKNHEYSAFSIEGTAVRQKVD